MTTPGSPIDERSPSAATVGAIAGLLIGGFLLLIALASWPQTAPKLTPYGLTPGRLTVLYLGWGALWGAIVGAWSRRIRTAADRGLAGSVVGLATYLAVSVLLANPPIVTALLGLIGAGLGAFVGVQVGRPKADNTGLDDEERSGT